MTATRIAWWLPARATWWTGALFAVGSTCFALGAFPPYAALVGGSADGVTYFVGSLFFTSAAFLQFRQSPDRVAWWAGLVQLAGTLFFNRSTFHALNASLSASEANRHVWTPDALGSIAFLVASALACLDIPPDVVRARGADWKAAWLNMVGSIAFGVSAVASYVVVDTGTLRDAERANLGTFVGALCFLAGALLILPRQPAVVDS